MRFTGIINNSNLGALTTAETVKATYGGMRAAVRAVRAAAGGGDGIHAAGA